MSCTQCIITAFLTIISTLAAAHVSNEELSNKELFVTIYSRNSWRNTESRSGKGSTLRETPVIRSILPTLLKKLDVKSLLDAGCGDFNWIKTLDLSFLDRYIGADIVPSVIKENSLRYSNAKQRFILLDIINDPLPQVDVILCRDCLQHLSNKDIFTAINNFKKSGATYLIASSAWTRDKNFDMPNTQKNILCRTTGLGRNMQLPPFNFPKPLEMIPEGFEGKSLCVWRIADLP